ncbi:unnamed protein product, partial [Orchesella dallaii]
MVRRISSGSVFEKNPPVSTSIDISPQKTRALQDHHRKRRIFQTIFRFATPLHIQILLVCNAWM